MASLYTGNLYPFLYRVCSADVNCDMTTSVHFREHGTQDKFIVYIGLFDYKYGDMEWACDEKIGKSPLVPDLDLVKEEYEFNTQVEALSFIRDWWKKQ